MILIDIYGNSMEPELKDGDTVLIDTSEKDILAGAIYAVGIVSVFLNFYGRPLLPNSVSFHIWNQH